MRKVRECQNACHSRPTAPVSARDSPEDEALAWYAQDQRKTKDVAIRAGKADNPFCDVTVQRNPKTVRQVFECMIGSGRCAKSHDINAAYRKLSEPTG